MTKRERVIRRAVATLETIDRETAKAVAADLRTLLPKRRPVPQHRKERAEPSRKQAEKAGRTAVYAAVVARDFLCSALLPILGECNGALQIDHQWGRGKAPTTVKNCRRLCLRHHLMKTDSVPSRVTWLQDFQNHCGIHDYRSEWVKAEGQIALELAQHPSGAKPLESAK